MRIVNRSALVPYSTEEMFALVADVASYPEFLPWCADAKVQRQTETLLEASLTAGLVGLKMSFATRNELNPPEHMSMQLLDGPFRTLEGHWAFEQIGDEGSEVSLRLEFEFSSAVQDSLFGAAFEKIANELIDAFVKRAHACYGSK